jgi:hypothetical protein
VKRQLGRSLEEVEEDESLNWTSKKIQFYLSEDTNTNEVTWNLRQLHREWEAVRKENERGRGGGGEEGLVEVWHVGG